jgi:predicted glycosyl hydrolase (DUF1957 family)
MLTRLEIEQALPANLKSAATDALTDMVNNIAADPLVAEQVRNNFIGYAGVMKEGKFKTEDYVQAVTYVSYKLMNYTNKEAYIRTFPQRYQNMVAKGISTQDMAAYISSYSRGKLVNMIMEQSLVPTWVLNQDMYQKALNVQVELMTSANSEKVRSDAANSILTHLKKPEATKFQIDVGVNESSGLNELKENLKKLAEMQVQLIEGGVETKLIAGSPLVEGEFKEI